jgi:hypothetical protein
MEIQSNMTYIDLIIVGEGVIQQLLGVFLACTTMDLGPA